MTIKEKAECIVKDIKQELGTSPLRIFKDIAEKDTVDTPFECSCCNRHTKILYGIGEACAYCAYCGVTI